MPANVERRPLWCGHRNSGDESHLVRSDRLGANDEARLLPHVGRIQLDRRAGVDPQCTVQGRCCDARNNTLLLRGQPRTDRAISEGWCGTFGYVDATENRAIPPPQLMPRQVAGRDCLAPTKDLLHGGIVAVDPDKYSSDRRFAA